VKVMFVLDSLAPGGTEHSTVLLAGELVARGHDITIATMKAAEHELDATATASGVSVVRLHPGRFLAQVRELHGLISEQKPDVVHTALFNADQLGRLAAIGTRAPVISSFVNTPYEAARLTDPNVRRWRLRTLQLVDAITGRLLVTRFHAVSEGTKKANAAALWLRLKRVTVAERGRDTASLGERTEERRQATRAQLGIGPDTPVALNLGRLEHQKAQVDLIRAANIVRVHHPDFRLWIAGKNGSATTAVNAELDARPNWDASIRLLGHRTDVGDLLGAADVLVISSHFEGTAGVALEAMAVGTPIVSTAVVGLEGVLEHERNAILVEVANPAALAAGIERLLDDPALAARLARAGVADFYARFTMEAGTDRLLDLYRSVIAGRPRARRARRARSIRS
jgi:glycosyltransferase involved in cell wall biosynthesis